MRRFVSASLLVAAGLLSAPASAALISTTIVISEFRVRGPAGGNDEYVELHNLSNAPVDISGYRIAGSNDTGSTSVRATIGASTILQPGAFHLVAMSSPQGVYSGTVAPDGKYSTSSGVTDNGGLGLFLPTGFTTAALAVDMVGMASGDAYKEGTTLTQMAANVNKSYRRKGGDCSPIQDTGVNSADFELVDSSPQNNASCCLDAQCTSPSNLCATCNVTTHTCNAAPGGGLLLGNEVPDQLPRDLCGSDVLGAANRHEI